MKAFTTATMIDQITLALLGEKPCAREKFVMTNTLAALVWLAKSEYKMEMNRSIQKLTAAATLSAAQRTAKAAIRKASAPKRQAELNLCRP